MIERADRAEPESGGTAPAPSRSFRLLRLTLAGFGVYDRETTFRFPGSACVLVGPNESGKSTLVHGIAAVLFGLPASKDPSAFSTERFRSFSRPRAFWGEVEWEADGVRYRLHRAFESHQVRLSAEEPAGVRNLWAGEHNVRATSTSGSAFLPELVRAFGISSLDLFQSTFCLVQPLPEENDLGLELQHLLSGSRTGRVDDVLSDLFDRVAALTRATKELGLVRPGRKRAASQRADGRIEELKDGLARDRKLLDEGRSLLEERNRNNLAIEDAQKELEKIREAGAERDRKLESLSHWMDLSEERRRRSDALGAVRAARRECDGIDREKRELEPLLAKLAASWESAPEDWERRCEEVENRAAEWARLIETSEARSQSIAEAEEAVRAREEEAAEAQSRLGLNPQALRLRAENCLRDLDRLEAVERRRAEIARQSEERAFLEGGRLERLREKISADERAREISMRLREVEAALALEEAARAAAPKRKSAGGLFVWIRLLAPLALGAALRFGLAQGWGVALAAAGALFLALSGADLLLRRRRRPESRAGEEPANGSAAVESSAAEPPAAEAARLRSEQTALAARTAAPAADLGPYAATTRSELQVLEERWKRFDEEEGALAREGDALREAWFPGLSGERAALLALPAEDSSPWRELLTLPGIPAAASCGELAGCLAAWSGPDWLRLEDECARAREAEERLGGAREILARERAARSGEEEGERGVRARRALAQEALSALRAGWPAAPVGEDAESSPEALARAMKNLREEGRRARELRARAEALRSTERRLLQAVRTEEAEALARREVEEEAALGTVVREMEKLERIDALLAPREGEDLSARAVRLQEQRREWLKQKGDGEAEAIRIERNIQTMFRNEAALDAQGTANLARLELGLRRAEEELRLATRERDALALAFTWTREAAEAYSRAYREELESRITERFGSLTGRRGRRVLVDEAFRYGLREPGGEALHPHQLSQGARDQLSLCIRLAVADLLTGSVPLPLIFDDPFVHYDRERLEHLRETLAALAGERQWILLTHREEFRSWGDEVLLETS